MNNTKIIKNIVWLEVSVKIQEHFWRKIKDLVSFYDQERIRVKVSDKVATKVLVFRQELNNDLNKRYKIYNKVGIK
jgi:hypothetical protein